MKLTIKQLERKIEILENNLKESRKHLKHMPESYFKSQEELITELQDKYHSITSRA